MSNDNKVLSQEEIDAMLAGGSDDGDDEGEAEIEVPSTPPVSESKPEPVVEKPDPAPVAVPEPPAPAPEPEPVAATPEPEPVAVIPEPAAPPPAPVPPPMPPPAPVAAPVPVPVPEPTLPPVPIVATVDDGALAALTERIERLEAALAESNNNVMRIHQEYQTLTTQVQLMGSRIEGILDNLKSTLGYRAQKTFTCGSCETVSNVAAKVKCTNCSKENWWGWWPQDP